MLIIMSTNTRPKQRTIQRGSGGGRRVSHLERLMGCSATALKRNSLFDLMTLYICVYLSLYPLLSDPPSCS